MMGKRRTIAGENTGIRSIIIILVLLVCLPADAGVFDAGFSSSGYAEDAGQSVLRLPVHAQCAGVEAATVAWRGDLAGLQYNPAILDATDSLTLLGTNSYMTFDRSHFGIDVASPIGELFVAGLSFSQTGVGKIEGRDDYGVETGNFDASFNTISAMVAGRLAIPVSIGLRGRYIFESIEKGHSNGFGFDAGATFQPIKQLCVGASIQNIASAVWWNTGRRDEVLLTGQLGVTGILVDNTLRMELDIIKTMQQPEEVACGAEYAFLQFFKARAGIREAAKTDTREIMKPEYSFGAGMHYDFLGFDYAIVIPASDLGAIHKISVICKIPANY